MNRRFFIKSSSVFLGGLPFQKLYGGSLDGENGFKKITILYTNDVHSRIDPFPVDHPQFPAQGGFSARAAIVDAVRREDGHVLLLDAGDMFQGTPYFNFYGGEAEFRLMSKMGYDCVTLGNHDFDNGVGGLSNMMKHARFSFVNSNYLLSDTELADKVRPYRIFRKGGLRVGVYGLGVDLNGLVNAHLRKNVVYGDPIQAALRTEKFLKQELGCDLVICLSHLGYAYQDNRISDKVLAPMLHFTDLIVGGHTHTFLKEPVKFVNKSGGSTWVTQVGWGGVILGRFDFVFDTRHAISMAEFSMYKISTKTTLG